MRKLKLKIIDLKMTKLIMINRWWESYKFAKLRMNILKTVFRRGKTSLWEKIFNHTFVNCYISSDNIV